MGGWPFVESAPTGASVAVLPDPASLALAAATVIVGEARRAVKDSRRFSMALAGGSTPKPIYKLLAEPPFAGLMPWLETQVFWGDERCVEPADPRSNERMAREALIDHVSIPAGQVHPMRCSGMAAETAAGEYERLLRRFFAEEHPAGALPSGPDLVLLGMGDNGHTASLFPGSDALDERERWVVAALEDPDTAEATSGTGERLWRVTLTASFINRAALALFVVSGASKAAAVKGVLEGEGDARELPARAIRPAAGRVLWMLDEEAASELYPGAGKDSARHASSCGAMPADPLAIESFDDLPDCELGPSR